MTNQLYDTRLTELEISRATDRKKKKLKLEKRLRWMRHCNMCHAAYVAVRSKA